MGSVVVLLLQRRAYAADTGPVKQIDEKGENRMSTVGPCLCGDPYCPRCGDPERGKCEEAFDDLLDALMEKELTVPEIMMVKAIALVCVEAHRCAEGETLSNMRQAEELENFYSEDEP